jgi:hypothetical protein
LPEERSVRREEEKEMKGGGRTRLVVEPLYKQGRQDGWHPSDHLDPWHQSYRDPKGVNPFGALQYNMDANLAGALCLDSFVKIIPLRGHFIKYVF